LNAIHDSYRELRLLFYLELDQTQLNSDFKFLYLNNIDTFITNQ